MQRCTTDHATHFSLLERGHLSRDAQHDGAVTGAAASGRSRSLMEPASHRTRWHKTRAHWHPHTVSAVKQRCSLLPWRNPQGTLGRRADAAVTATPGQDRQTPAHVRHKLREKKKKESRRPLLHRCPKSTTCSLRTEVYIALPSISIVKDT